MAREEAPREDLLREATAFVERISLRLPAHEEPVFVGFRRTGDVSFYFGEDPVYHFNASGTLRRAFCEGLLIKAEHGQLVRLRRERPGGEVHLVRHELTAEETKGFLRRATEALEGLGAALAGRKFSVVGQVPDDAPVAERVRDWLATHPEIQIAHSPHAGR